jgi:hypothetical protein
MSANDLQQTITLFGLVAPTPAILVRLAATTEYLCFSPTKCSSMFLKVGIVEELLPPTRQSAIALKEA